MNLTKALSLRIEEVCKMTNSNVSKISLSGGMSPSNIYDIMKGRTKGTEVLTIAKFCDGAGITMTSFFDSPLFDNLDLE